MVIDTEHVIVLDGRGCAVAIRPKVGVHGPSTPLHLAFSCYAVDDAGRVLLAQRARSKRTFPGVWSNACCGHPQIGETLREAVERRLREELGVVVERAAVVLPDFTYRASMDDGTVEHERCPVVRARWTGAGDEPRLDPTEVETAGWQTWRQCLDLAGDPAASPWYRLQMERLAPLGEPAGWPAADLALLPPALSW